MQVVLIGPPGAGKTTVGEALAGELGLPLRDTDRIVEQRAGCTVAELFVEHGEARFRELETEAVREALDAGDGVVALGGGAPLDPRTQQRLRGRTVVLLDVDLAHAADRVGLARSRPVLMLNPRAELHRLLSQRRPTYERLATVTVDTAGRTVEEVVATVREAIA